MGQLKRWCCWTVVGEVLMTNTIPRIFRFHLLVESVVDLKTWRLDVKRSEKYIFFCQAVVIFNYYIKRLDPFYDKSRTTEAKSKVVLVHKACFNIGKTVDLFLQDPLPLEVLLRAGVLLPQPRLRRHHRPLQVIHSVASSFIGLFPFSPWLTRW